MDNIRNKKFTRREVLVAGLTVLGALAGSGAGSVNAGDKSPDNEAREQQERSEYVEAFELFKKILFSNLHEEFLNYKTGVTATEAKSYILNAVGEVAREQLKWFIDGEFSNEYIDSATFDGSFSPGLFSNENTPSKINISGSLHFGFDTNWLKQFTATGLFVLSYPDSYGNMQEICQVIIQIQADKNDYASSNNFNYDEKPINVGLLFIPFFDAVESFATGLAFTISPEGEYVQTPATPEEILKTLTGQKTNNTTTGNLLNLIERLRQRLELSPSGIPTVDPFTLNSNAISDTTKKLQGKLPHILTILDPEIVMPNSETPSES